MASDDADLSAAQRHSASAPTPSTVLVTGCSSGIGRATANAFLAEGWDVFATARDPADLTDLGDAGCRTKALDVTDYAQIPTIVEEIQQDTGRIDCLVNNAGYAQFGPVEDIASEKVQRQFAVNVFGPQQLIRSVLPGMREYGEGTIVNVSSVVGELTHPLGGIYCGSKTALETMSDALRVEVEPFGVDVVIVQPGPVTTSFQERARQELPANAERTDAYEADYSALLDIKTISRDGPFSVGPDTVAQTILHAATCPDPSARYPVGLIAKLAGYSKFLPDRVHDFGYRALRRLVT